ncbi:MAG: DsbA family protein [Pseudomonadota bacterium]
MRLSAALKNRITRSLFGPKRRDALRAKAERQRSSNALPHVVEYFHEAGDPYSHLMVQLLPAFVERYAVELRVHITPEPPDWAAPDRARLQQYARRDAAQLARKSGLSFSDPEGQPTPEALAQANATLLSAVQAGTFLDQAFDIGETLWRSEPLEATSLDPKGVSDALAVAFDRRDKLGHYLGGTLYYAGEWYWGPDRLHFLEARLQSLGVGETARAIWPPPSILSDPPSGAKDQRPELHWYLSFRSPYTGIVRDRIKALAEAYDADLKLRYVLPMVMRGMQVPRKKGFYIMSDTVREAERLDVSFGNSVDPVGKPVERGYAILHQAIQRDRGYEFAQSFLSGVWADGLDAGSDNGLKVITERAGLSWSEMKPFLDRGLWREQAEANQQEMFSFGLWGVPSFRVGQVATWGQDRLWVIEDALKAARDTGSENAGHK